MSRPHDTFSNFTKVELALAADAVKAAVGEHLTCFVDARDRVVYRGNGNVLRLLGTNEAVAGTSSSGLRAVPNITTTRIPAAMGVLDPVVAAPSKATVTQLACSLSGMGLRSTDFGEGTKERRGVCGPNLGCLNAAYVFRLFGNNVETLARAVAAPTALPATTAPATLPRVPRHVAVIDEVEEEEEEDVVALPPRAGGGGRATTFRHVAAAPPPIPARVLAPPPPPAASALNSVRGYVSSTAKAQLARRSSREVVVHNLNVCNGIELEVVSLRELAGLSTRPCERCGGRPLSYGVEEDDGASVSLSASEEEKEDEEEARPDARIGFVSATGSTQLERGQVPARAIKVHRVPSCGTGLLRPLMQSTVDAARGNGAAFVDCKRCPRAAPASAPAAAAAPRRAAPAPAPVPVPAPEITLHVRLEVQAPLCVRDVLSNERPLPPADDLVWVSPLQRDAAVAAARELRHAAARRRSLRQPSARAVALREEDTQVHVHATGRDTGPCSVAAGRALQRVSFSSLRDDDGVHLVPCPVCYAEELVRAAANLRQFNTRCQHAAIGVLQPLLDRWIQDDVNVTARVAINWHISDGAVGGDTPFQLTRVLIAATNVDAAPAAFTSVPLRRAVPGTASAAAVTSALATILPAAAGACVDDFGL